MEYLTFVFMGFIDLFKSRKKAQITNFEAWGVDIHSHLLPGIDDGSQTLDQTIGMILKFKALGYKKLIVTPHVKSGVYDNSSDLILQKLEEVKAEIKRLDLGIEIEASAEYFFDETLFERISANNLLPFHGNHILFELSFNNEPKQIDELIFLLKAAGYQPIMAHFERYMYYHGSVDMAKYFQARGCWIQMNLNSLSGHYGPDVKKQAQKMIKENAVDIVGSDCHRMEHLQTMEKHLHQNTFKGLFDLPLKNNLFQ